MRRDYLFILVVLLAVFLVLPFGVHARGAGAKFKHADRNKDGVLDKKEIRMEKQWEHKKRSEVNNWWEKRADTDSDGVVDKGELNAWKNQQRSRMDLDGDGQISPKERRLSWRHARSRVNTAVERKYDSNSDGWLEAAEVKEMLQAKHALIKSNGKAKVDTVMNESFGFGGQNNVLIIRRFSE